MGKLSLVLLVGLLVGCADPEERPRPTDEELHAIGECSGWSGPPDSCEAACGTRDPERDAFVSVVGDGCVSHWPIPDPRGGTGMFNWGCPEEDLWEYEGVLGCCALLDGAVRFAVCEGE